MDNNTFKYLFFKRSNNIITEIELLPLTGKMNTLKPHAAKNASQKACLHVCVKSVFLIVCVLISVTLL